MVHSDPNLPGCVVCAFWSRQSIIKLRAAQVIAEGDRRSPPHELSTHSSVARSMLSIPSPSAALRPWCVTVCSRLGPTFPGLWLQFAFMSPQTRNKLRWGTCLAVWAMAPQTCLRCLR